MGSLKKFNNSQLASSYMVDARRDEVAKLEKKRLEINAKLEQQMKKYAKATGDRSVARRRHTLGKAPNDWKPSINSTGVKRPLKTYEKVLIALAVVFGVVFIGELILVYFEIDFMKVLTDIFSKLFNPVEAV